MTATPFRYRLLHVKSQLLHFHMPICLTYRLHILNLIQLLQFPSAGACAILFDTWGREGI